MPLTPEQNEELGLILEALEPETKNMDSVPQTFANEQIEKHARYGSRLFLSDKQFAWLRRLYVEFVGPLEHLPLTSRGAREDLIGNDDED
jgi:hypothetical protein